ncbi:MAG: type II toxin-antitoxin system RelE/ParE family toxin [Acidobacteriota bacterium]
MRRLRFELEAVEEIEQAAEWYEERRPGLARRFLGEIERAQLKVAERPASYPRIDAPSPDLVIRRALLSRFPYALVFLDRDEEVRILAVAHTKQRPGYWLNRLRYT